MSFRRPLVWLVLFFLLLEGPIARAETVFSDVASNHPHYQAIQSLLDSKIIQGYPDNTFRPEQTVNRAEALKIILLGSDIFVPETQPTNPFPDVSADVWYAKYVAKAKGLGIVSGDSTTGLFRPGDPINLAEILKILIEAKGIEVKPAAATPFADVPTDAWFAPYFDYAKFIGLLDEQGKDSVHPDHPVNRGLLAEFLYRIRQKPKTDEYGKASFYGDKFHGRTTASGDVFDASDLTAAHRIYPFGTWLRVTNTENGQSVDVRVNDRGPYGDSQRILDLSKAAFERIAPLSRGVIWVTIQKIQASAVVAPPAAATPPVPLAALNAVPQKCLQDNELQWISPDTFSGVTLTQAIPNRLVSEEVLHLTGQLSSSAASLMTAFLVDSDDHHFPFQAPLSADGHFAVDVSFPHAGDWQLGILPGETGSSVAVPVKALSYACLQEKEIPDLPPPAAPEVHLNKGETALTWPAGSDNLFQLSLIQGSHFKRILLHDFSEWKAVYSDFSEFAEGAIEVHLRSAHIDARSPLLADTIRWSPPATLTLSAVTHHALLLELEQVEVPTLTSFASQGDFIRIPLKAKTSLRSDAAVILPTGEVATVPLTAPGVQPIKNKNGISIFPPDTSSLTFDYRTRQAGLHFIEINNAEGLAVLNLPLYPPGSFPILPNVRELGSREPAPPGDDLALRVPFMNRINQDRQAQGRGAVKLDSALNSLAQARAQDMSTHDYFGHWNPDGLSSNDLRKNFGITQIVSENLAKDLSLESAEYGLLRSAIHRENLMNAEWTRAGIGISRAKDGSFLFVQLFSAEPFDLKNLDSLRETVRTALNKNRETSLTPDAVLHSLAQHWSESMVEKNFFSFTGPDGKSLFDAVAQAGFTQRVGTYIVGNTSFAAALDQISANPALRETNWKTIGIGIKQDALGVFKITLLYSE